eukprot:4606566-Amphidinium_carterae.4
MMQADMDIVDKNDTAKVTFVACAASNIVGSMDFAGEAEAHLAESSNVYFEHDGEMGYEANSVSNVRVSHVRVVSSQLLHLCSLQSASLGEAILFKSHMVLMVSHNIVHVVQGLCGQQRWHRGK